MDFLPAGLSSVNFIRRLPLSQKIAYLSNSGGSFVNEHIRQIQIYKAVNGQTL